MDINDGLTDREKIFLERTVKRKKLFLIFSILSVAAAIAFSIFHALVMKDFNAPRFVIVLLLLLSGRSHLRQYRSALIFNKLKSRLGT